MRQERSFSFGTADEAPHCHTRDITASNRFTSAGVTPANREDREPHSLKRGAEHALHSRFLVRRYKP